MQNFREQPVKFDTAPWFGEASQQKFYHEDRSEHYELSTAPEISTYVFA
jgi:hypothetical protein